MKTLFFTNIVLGCIQCDMSLPKQVIIGWHDQALILTVVLFGNVQCISHSYKPLPASKRCDPCSCFLQPWLGVNRANRTNKHNNDPVKRINRHQPLYCPLNQACWSMTNHHWPLSAVLYTQLNQYQQLPKKVILYKDLILVSTSRISINQ